MSSLAAACVTLATLLPTPALAQPARDLVGARVQERTDALLTLMGFGLTPDVTLSSLSISDTSSGEPRIRSATLGGGFTFSRELPLYLEGTVAYSRYDPSFVVSDGRVERTIPTRWNMLSVTAGVGWDIRLARELVLRPILNASYGRVTTDAAIGAEIVDAELQALRNGRMEAVGLGGSLMLDYERFRPEGDLDAELRYTDIRLRNSGDFASATPAGSVARSLNLWTRWRAPTGVVVFDRPLRYVLEFAHTRYLGDLEGALGFDHMNSVGAGVELDTSRFERWVTRVRLVARHRFGPDVRGTSIGLAVSF
ncbi:MAG: autotransporter domain-containing protein [Burkholderiales bacterium]